MLQFNNAKNECINVNTKEEIILKKLVSLLEAILLMVMAFPLTALAGQEGTQIISPVFCIPFAGLLLCVAIMPLVKAEWWESHQPHAVVFWSVLFVIPFAIFFGAGEATEKAKEVAGVAKEKSEKQQAKYSLKKTKQNWTTQFKKLQAIIKIHYSKKSSLESQS